VEEQFNGLLTATVFLPLVGALAIATIIRGDQRIRIFAAAVALADLVLAIVVFSVFYDRMDSGGFHLIDKVNWIGAGSPFNNETFTASYHLGVDGISAPLVLLTGLLGFCAIVASWHIELRVKEYFIWLLVLQTAVMGVFTSLDLLLFFLFWELELLPMYLLISIWGSGRKEYSAMKFLIFTILGSAFMLVSIVATFVSLGTFNIVELSQMGSLAAGAVIPVGILFWFFIIAFIIKLPLWPVHTWLPDAHTDAPTAVSVMLAGVLLKMGGYGLIRICVGLFPGIEGANTYGWALVVLAVISVLYGAIVTIRQTDLKRLIAYSSVSHMGLVMLGVAVAIKGSSDATQALTGASMQMFAHGTITGLLFLAVGLVYDKAHTRYIPDLGGLATRMPFISATFLIAGLASLGLPGLSGFVAEIITFLGAFESFPWPTVLAAFGIVLAAGYILWMIERVLFGPSRERFAHLSDAGVIEAIPLSLLVISIVVIGFYPAFVTDVFDVGVRGLIP
jgi:NADH-quinone oxidoreductase subunit M